MKIDPEDTGDGGLAFEPALEIKLLHHNAKVPVKAHGTDAGFDLFASDKTRVYDTRVWVRTGVAIDIPPGYQGRVTGKSGLSGEGLTVITGTVDAGYQGEIKVLMEFHPTDGDDSFPVYVFEAGDKIAQIIIEPVSEFSHCVVVDEFKTETARGEKGFGSTGK